MAVNDALINITN